MLDDASALLPPSTLTTRDGNRPVRAAAFSLLRLIEPVRAY
jgi:hypothetical protein